MNNFSPTSAAPRALALLFAAALFVAAHGARVAACAPAQSGRVPPKLQQPTPQPRQAKPAEDDDEEEEGESESAGSAAVVVKRPQSADPGTVLRKARYVFVRSDSAFVSGREVEASLQKRKEFKAWGMVVTRDAARADLVIEITRRPLTRRFTFTVIDPASLEVVASGKTRSVLFGKKIPNKIAEKFANRVKVYRPYP
ncbi:MAG: hypothetical protein LC795_00280 [Acidobacteria bacterium]|nr:hypothetical protein [Acidobacteriota bacterium]